MTAQNRFCEDCGAQSLTETAKFCSKCGTQLFVVPPEQKRPATTQLEASAVRPHDSNENLPRWCSRVAARAKRQPFFRSTPSWQEGWKRWKDFHGVTGRRKFWEFVRMQLLGSLVTVLLLQWIPAGLLKIDSALLDFLTIAVMMSCLVWIVPLLAAMTRRLRDAGLNPFLILLVMIPLIGWPTLWVLAAQPSKTNVPKGFNG